jgi:hypothetical protein
MREIDIKKSGLEICRAGGGPYPASSLGSWGTILSFAFIQCAIEGINKMKVAIAGGTGGNLIEVLITVGLGEHLVEEFLKDGTHIPRVLSRKVSSRLLNRAISSILTRRTILHSEKGTQMWNSRW